MSIRKKPWNINSVDIMKKRTILIIALLIIAAGSSAGEVFINWRAGYYISIPDNWFHVPFKLTEDFLRTQEVTPGTFDYDAAIALKSEEYPFSEPYIFLTSRLIGELSPARIDTALKEISNEYRKFYIRGTIDRGDEVYSLNQPVYDAERQAVVIKSRISTEVTTKYLFEIYKFYEKGIATFLCFATEEQYIEAQPVFIEILHSFSTENIEQMAEKDTAHQFVDISDKERAKYKDGDFPESGKDYEDANSTNKTVMIVILAAIIIVVIIVLIKRKKQ
jgi:hypothetical protein